MVDTGNVQGLEERRRFWRCDADVWTDAPFTSTSFALGGCAPVAVIGAARAAWLIAGSQARRLAVGSFHDPHGTVTNPPKRIVQSGYRTKVT